MSLLQRLGKNKFVAGAYLVGSIWLGMEFGAGYWDYVISEKRQEVISKKDSFSDAQERRGTNTQIAIYKSRLRSQEAENKARSESQEAENKARSESQEAKYKDRIELCRLGRSELSGDLGRCQGLLIGTTEVAIDNANIAQICIDTIEGYKKALSSCQETVSAYQEHFINPKHL
jgi:hypothetical protein